MKTLLALAAAALAAAALAPAAYRSVASSAQEADTLRVAAPLRSIATEDGPPFGGAHQGFAAWLSANGRYAALYRFDRDSDGDGKVSIEFGDHGEPIGDAPRVAVADTRTGAIRVYDELLATDPVGRYAALRGGGRIWLLDAETGQADDLTARGADPRDDHNPCFAPRQPVFSPDGARVAWLRAAPERAVLRDLRTGAETEVPAAGALLWRAEPAAASGRVFLYEVSGDTDGNGKVDFPRQQTTCACRWCGRFAGSWSFMGWGGDAFGVTLASASGARTRLAGPPVELAGGYRLEDWKQVAGPRGAVPLPPGCEPEQVFPRAAALLLECGDGRTLWSAAEGRGRPLPAEVEMVEDAEEAVARNGTVWVAVTVDSGDATRLGRMRLPDGRVQPGPVVREALARDTAEVLGLGADGVVLFRVATGEVRRLPLPAPGEEDYAGREVLYRLAVAPDGSGFFVPRALAAARNARGCVVDAEGETDRLERGPWRVRCPKTEKS